MNKIMSRPIRYTIFPMLNAAEVLTERNEMELDEYSVVFMKCQCKMEMCFCFSF